jgi:hypothetical protein
VSIFYNLVVKFSGLGMVLVLLSACGHTPISSMVKLRNFDPATTDVKQLSVAVDLPHEYRVQEDGVTMTLELRKKDGTETKRENFILTTSLSSEDKLMLAKISEPGRQIIAYRIRPSDIKRFNALRKFTIENRPSKLWEGSFSIGANACRINVDQPQTLPVTLYLKSSETKAFVPFIVNADLMQQPDGKNLHKAVPVCETNDN